MGIDKKQVPVIEGTFEKSTYRVPGAARDKNRNYTIRVKHDLSMLLLTSTRKGDLTIEGNDLVGKTSQDLLGPDGRVEFNVCDSDTGEEICMGAFVKPSAKEELKPKQQEAKKENSGKK